MGHARPLSVLALAGNVAVVGFDDLPVSAVFEAALTTIAQPMRQLGAVAAELLLNRLAGQLPG